MLHNCVFVMYETLWHIYDELSFVYTESWEVTVSLCAAGSSSHPAIRAQLTR